jgi:hypothetical protein
MQCIRVPIYVTYEYVCTYVRPMYVYYVYAPMHMCAKFDLA